MSFDFEKILKSKRALRREIAARPIGGKPCTLMKLRLNEIALKRFRGPMSFC